MATRTCAEDGCTRTKIQARGFCATHYSYWYRRTHVRDRSSETHTITCTVCGVEYKHSRPDGKFCSDTCKGQAYSARMATRCRLPKDHAVIRLIAEAKQREREQRDADQLARRLAWRTPRECPGCGAVFCPLYSTNQLTCSKRCSRRVVRRARRASEVGAYGTWIWSDFMRIAQRFGFCCAYCGDKPEGQLDPDHVVPLSRGGANTASNLLPACRSCNQSKSARTLDEWAEWRASRGLLPRLTAWAPEDRRYHHLSVSSVSNAA